MKKIKILNILAIIMLLFSIGMVIYRIIESIVYNVNGWYLAIPGPALFKWYEIFCFNLLMDSYYIVPSLIIGIILLIINHIKNDSGKKEIMKDKEVFPDGS